LLSVFTVTNNTASGPGSLFQAIRDADNAVASFGGTQTVNFSIGTGPQTITQSNLPAVSVGITIDGTTQPGFSGKPIIQLVESSLVLEGNDTVRSLVINQPSVAYGVLWFQGNGNIVTGNYIGTDITGELAPGGLFGGIYVGSSNNIIGGTTPGSGNVISGNSNGIAMQDKTDVNNLIEGNLIGTDATGNNPLPNRFDGIDSLGSNTIGGATPGSGNVIAMSEIYGQMGGAGISAGPSDVIQGNFIGTDVTGTKAFGNSTAGVVLPANASITLGGTSPAAGNVISGNNEGILIEGEGDRQTPDLIENNLIGTAADGQTPLGNSFQGILIDLGANDCNIVHNTVAYNGGPGIDVKDGVGNLISRNSTFFNAGLGIDLGDDGITPNNTGFMGGPNNFQNYPILTSVTNASGTTTIQGTLNSLPSTSYTIEVFSNSVVDPSLYIEGRTYLGSTTVLTDASGNASFSFVTPTTSDTVFTATATDPTNDTSEFYQPKVINGVPRVYAEDTTSFDQNSTGLAEISITGANFNANTVVYFQNVAVAMGAENSGLLVRLTAANLAREGTFQITVVNPAPGGGSVSFPITILTTLPDGTRGTPHQRFVAQLYRDLLKRDVDASGLAGWTAALDQGESTASVVSQIEQTPEYRTDEVQAIYEQYLHRAADSSGLSGFVSMLMHGSTVEQVAAIIAGSAEFFQTQGGGTSDGFLTAFYQDALNRLVDGSGLNTWEHALNSGATRAAVAAAILGSPEYQQDLINGLYLQFLERTPDPGGLASWGQLLQNGGLDETVIAGITGSPEYYNLVSR
jgi:parallel beta-helix repeat protein